MFQVVSAFIGIMVILIVADTVTSGAVMEMINGFTK